MDDDVADALERRCRERDRSLEQEVNDLVRAGLVHVERERPKAAGFRVEPLEIGKPRVDNFDDTSAIMAIAEGENYR